jgi:hypothetical protein
MKKAVSLVLLCTFWFSTALMSQGIIQNGGSIVVGSGAYIKVNGVNGNYKSTGNIKISLSPNSFLIVDNHWINDGSSVVFTNNQGKVELTSASAEIKGNKTTHFPELNLSGNGSVYMFVIIIFLTRIIVAFFTTKLLKSWSPVFTPLVLLKIVASALVIKREPATLSTLPAKAVTLPLLSKLVTPANRVISVSNINDLPVTLSTFVPIPVSYSFFLIA